MTSGIVTGKISLWNRLLHIFTGLFLLLFIWLFSLSGLLLNHGQWKFSSFWEKRKESVIVTPVYIPATADTSAVILSILDQLKISGEISNVACAPEKLNFRVAIPGTVRDIQIDFKEKICNQKVVKFNFWGKIRTLHTFNGADRNNPDVRPNWIVTKIWSGTMDGIALGLIILCLSSWLMWYNVRKIYPAGFYVLILGFTGAFFFVFLI